jgi:7,8-dihydropterin-6-yl-methyl-4-(beta-D-ribofuranosyl)aminobenzene 5'-phosphate synthase
MTEPENIRPSDPSMGLGIAVLADNAALPGFEGEHGLSMALTLPAGGLWLWDTGQTGLFLANAKRLGLDLAMARGVALSHGHYDHTGGLEYLLRLPGFRGEVVAHPAFAIPHYRRSESRLACDIGCPCPEVLLSSSRLRVVHSDARLDGQGLFMLTAIPRKPGNPQAVQDMYLDPRGEWSDIIPADACLVFKRGEDMAVILGCCHSGLANTLEDVRRRFGAGRYAVGGGLHLWPGCRRCGRGRRGVARTRGTEGVPGALHRGRGRPEDVRGPAGRVFPLAAGMVIEDFDIRHEKNRRDS